jgi:hypothetical protein
MEDNHNYLLPARCFRGIPASTRAAHAALMAHGRSYAKNLVKEFFITLTYKRRQQIIRWW